MRSLALFAFVGLTLLITSSCSDFSCGDDNTRCAAAPPESECVSGETTECNFGEPCPGTSQRECWGGVWSNCMCVIPTSPQTGGASSGGASSGGATSGGAAGSAGYGGADEALGGSAGAG